MRRELRVRTKIDYERRRAEDERLFAYEMVVPDGWVWRAAVDLEAVPAAERAAVVRGLEALFQSPLRGFGKTKVSLEVSFATAPAGEPRHTSSLSTTATDGDWVVTLQTPTLICDPELIVESSGDEALGAAYARAWNELSGGCLALKRFFAAQSLRGGYLVKRFRPPGESYAPYLLTDEGSVFVLSAVAGREAEPPAHLDSWLAHGLPLPEWARARYRGTGGAPLDWTSCPFRREEGFGEIAVNLECHHKNKAPGVPFHAIPKPLAD